MNLLQLIKHDALEARKQRQSKTALALTTLIGELETFAKNAGHEPTDADVVTFVKKTLKNIDETLKVLHEDDDRQVDLQHEQHLFSHYLPKQLSEDELRAVIKVLITGGATSVGDCMKTLKAQHAGTYDGAMASSILKQEFAK